MILHTGGSVGPSTPSCFPGSEEFFSSAARDVGDRQGNRSDRIFSRDWSAGETKTFGKRGVPFGRHGYVIRYSVQGDGRAILVTRIWHGRERPPP